MFLSTYHGFNYGVTVFYLGDLGVLGLVLDACGWLYCYLYNIMGRSLKMLAMKWKSSKQSAEVGCVSTMHLVSLFGEEEVRGLYPFHLRITQI